MKKTKAWYLSSDNSGDLGLTVRSILLGIVPVLVTVAKLHGYEIAENDIVELINNAFALIAVGGVIVGLVRKIYFAFYPNK